MKEKKQEKIERQKYREEKQTEKEEEEEENMNKRNKVRERERERERQDAKGRKKKTRRNSISTQDRIAVFCSLTHSLSLDRLSSFADSVYQGKTVSSICCLLKLTDDDAGQDIPVHFCK